MSIHRANEAIAEAAVSVSNAGDFPAAFDGSRPLFGLALFALIWVTAIAVSILWQSISDARKFPTPWREPLGVSRTIEAGVMLTIIMGAGPDTAVMLMWGEVADHTIQLALAFDRLCDLTCAIPFTLACWLRVRAGPVIGFQLTRQPIPMDLTPTLAMLRDKLYIAGLIGMLAAGVAIGK